MNKPKGNIYMIYTHNHKVTCNFHPYLRPRQKPLNILMTRYKQDPTVMTNAITVKT